MLRLRYFQHQPGNFPSHPFMLLHVLILLNHYYHDITKRFRYILFMQSKVSATTINKIVIYQHQGT